MKRYIALTFVCLGMAVALASCRKETLSPESVITVDAQTKNDFDKWLDANYVHPYNIQVKYRYEMNESDMNYFTIPAEYEYSIVMAHLVKYLCVETYDEVAGITFTRNYFPKMFFLTGEWEYRNNGTIILGTAEGGKKIFLAGVNLLNETMEKGYGDFYGDPIESLNHYFIKTIHHEFTHIMNQTKEIPADFQLVTGDKYVGDMWSEEPYDKEYLANGFITAYSQNSYQEDFAEMLSTYITNDASQWEEWLEEADKAAAEKAKKTGETTTAPSELLSSKLDIVRRYMKESFNIDIDVLRETVQRRQADVFAGKVDLTDITVK